MNHSIPSPTDILPDETEIALSLNKAYHFAILAGLANKIPKLVKSTLRSVLLSKGWTGVRVWGGKNNEGFFLSSPKLNVVVFAGTNSPADWWKNIKAFFPENHPIGGKVHRGFSIVLGEEIETLLSNDLGEDADVPLYIVGHSLGGAVATGFFAHLLGSGNPWAEKSRAITFGMPRLGNREFELAYESKTRGRHWFFANSRDPVTKLPTNFMGYKHVGKLHYFTKVNALTTPPPNSVGLENMNPLDRTIDETARINWSEEESDMLHQTRNILSDSAFEAFAADIQEKVDQNNSRISLNEDTEELEAVEPEAELHGAIGSWIAERHAIDLYIENILNSLPRS